MPFLNSVYQDKYWDEQPKEETVGLRLCWGIEMVEMRTELGIDIFQGGPGSFWDTGFRQADMNGSRQH